MKRILSASRRTDLPAAYGRWFRERLHAGFARYRTPFSPRLFEVSLRREDLAGIVFWTRDVFPFLPVLDILDDGGFPYYFQYTWTAYPRSLEPAGDPERRLRGLLRLSDRIGPDRVVWRYDPIILTAGLEEGDHLRRFRAMAARLRGRTDTVMVSFLDPYRKTVRRLSAAGIETRFPSPEEGGRLILRLSEIAGEAGIRLATCCEEGFRPEGVAAGACVDVERIRRIAPEERFTAGRKPTREGCGCAESRDIGAYDTCPLGCVYCYAVSDDSKAGRAFRAHRAAAEALRE
ncbi:MAG: DUF1848 domain-containing protein [Candidatus Eisenbacteria bacterium]